MQVAIICEYNPFHNGHKYQIDKIREVFGEDVCITAIMGGIFSQRGTPYIATPYARAKSAVECGADLVIELPFPFSCAPASVFARAGVSLAAAVGADVLAFGSESGDIDILRGIISRLDGAEVRKLVDEYSIKEEFASLGQTRLFEKAYSELYGECASLKNPNDILGLEYIRAIENSGVKITPFTIRRVGDYRGGEGGFASAGKIRGELCKGKIDSMVSDVPKAAFDIYKEESKKGLFPSDEEKISSAVLLSLRAGVPQESEIAYTGGGIANLLCKNANCSQSLAELYSLCATKRYTDAALRRGALYACLRTEKAQLASDVYYTRLLAASPRGQKVLSSGKIGVDVLTKPSAYGKMSARAAKQFADTFGAEQYFSLCFDGKYAFLAQSPYFIKDINL